MLYLRVYKNEIILIRLLYYNSRQVVPKYILTMFEKYSSTQNFFFNKGRSVWQFKNSNEIKLIRIGKKKYPSRKRRVIRKNYFLRLIVKGLVYYRHNAKSIIGFKNNLNCLFLRKTRQYNKGRYSRNRQIYRTGVYLCLFINIIVLNLLWFTFYKFSLKYTYLWWLFLLLPGSFVFSRSLKYNIIFYRGFCFYLKCYLRWLWRCWKLIKDFFINFK